MRRSRSAASRRQQRRQQLPPKPSVAERRRVRDRRQEANELQLGRFSEIATMSECAELVHAFSNHALRRRTRSVMEKTVGIETPVIRGAEAAATLRAILKASATGRHARGPLLARRLLEYRG